MMRPNGMTFSMMGFDSTLSITTFSITTLSMTTPNRVTFSMMRAQWA
jgi:hypothetical protein